MHSDVAAVQKSVRMYFTIGVMLLIFTGVTVFGFVLAWHFGLIRLMLASDKTHISAIICALYFIVSLHCLMQTVVVSRELNSGHRAYALEARGWLVRERGGVFRAASGPAGVGGTRASAGAGAPSAGSG